MMTSSTSCSNGFHLLKILTSTKKMRLSNSLGFERVEKLVYIRANYQNVQQEQNDLRLSEFSCNDHCSDEEVIDVE